MEKEVTWAEAHDSAMLHHKKRSFLIKEVGPEMFFGYEDNRIIGSYSSIEEGKIDINNRLLEI